MSYTEQIDSSLVDPNGNRVEVGVFGGLKTSNPSPQISVTFDRPLTDSIFTITGTPIAQYNRSLARLQNGDALETLTKLRYRTAQTIEIFFTAAFVGDFSPGVEQTLAGLYDTEDGVFLGYIGDQFVVGYRNVNVGADVVQPVTPPPNVDNVYRYRVKFGYLGVGDITFEYKRSGEDWQLLHTFPTDGMLNGRTHIGSPILPMGMNCGHDGCEVLTGSWNAQTFGADSNLQELPFYYGSERDVPGNITPQPLVAFRNKTTLGAYNNKIILQLLDIEIATGSEGLYIFELYVFPPGTITSGSWFTPNANSVGEANETFTEGIAGGQKAFGFHVAVPSLGTGVGTVNRDLTRLDLLLPPVGEAAFFKRQIVGGGGDDITSWALNYLDLF